MPDETFKVYIVLFTFLSLVFWDLPMLMSVIYWRSITIVDYNWQPPHKLTPTNTIGITNTNIEIPDACIDRVSRCSSKRTKFRFISVNNKSQKLSTRRKARLIQKKFVHHITTIGVPKVDTYLYIPEAVGGVWLMNKSRVLSPIKFKKTLSIPLNMRGQERIGYMLYSPIP